VALGGEQCARQRQQLLAEAIRQQAVVADADESAGQNVQEEAAQELDGVEGHDALLAAVSIIPPAKTRTLSVEGQQAMVGDGHAVGIAAEIAQHMGRAAEGRLGINEPFRPSQLRGHFLEPCRITEGGCWTAAVEQVPAVEPP